MLSDKYHSTLVVISIGTGYGLVPTANKPLHGPILTKIHDAAYRHQATMS